MKVNKGEKNKFAKTPQSSQSDSLDFYPESPTVKSKGFSWYFKIVLVLGLICTFNFLSWNYMPKSTEMQVFQNDISEGESYNISFILHDNRSSKSHFLYKKNDLVYSPSSSLNTIGFQLNVTKNDIQRESYRFKLETQIIYNSKKLGTQKIISCFSGITDENSSTPIQKNEADIISNSTSGRNQNYLILSKIYFNLVFDSKNYDFTEDEITKYLYQQNPQKRTPEKSGVNYYVPHLDCNSFWTLERDQFPFEHYENLTSILIKIDFKTVKLNEFRFILLLHIIEKQFPLFLNRLKIMEEIKVFFTDNNFYFILLILFVNLLHTIFYRSVNQQNLNIYRKFSLSGKESPINCLINSLFQLVIFLYLWENKASIFLILFSTFEGILSIFILTKAIKSKINSKNDSPFSEFQKPANFASNETKSITYPLSVYVLIFPVLVIFGISFISFKFWNDSYLNLYELILESLVYIIYTIGFINMTSQIYINYQQKSVEFVSWSLFICFFLNCIIDDLFVFSLKMPLLRRISSFRDDIIFVVYLVQLWLYQDNIKDYNSEKIKVN